MISELCKCGGSGLEERGGKLFECICSYLRRRSADMPPYIRRADVFEDHLKLSISKSVDKSFFLISTWQDMKALIKLSMIRNPNLFLKITSDSEILNVSLGKTSRSSRGADAEEAVYNSIQDLMEPPMLAVIRLNELSYKNKAAAGYLEEALSYRLDRDKPTWVISDKNKPYSLGSPAWSDSVNDILHSALKTVQIPIVSPIITIDNSMFAPELIQSSGMQSMDSRTGEERNRAVKAMQESSKSESDSQTRKVKSTRIQSMKDDEEDNNGGLGMYGKGLPKPKPFGRGQ